MSQQPPGQLSPDGKWRWDGRQWIPNMPVLPPGGYLVQPSPGGMVVAPKNPALSLIVSFFIPGVGSMMNGDVTTGVAILVLFIVGIATSVVFVGIFLILGAWIWGMIDAYQGAQSWNRAHGILS
jgi:TM2 domain-containing membrane protein YozV